LKKIILKVIIVLMVVIFGGCFGDDDNKSKVVLIELSSNIVKVSADDIEQVIFTATAYDENQEEKEADIKLYKDGVEYTGLTFKTAVAGSYKFTAKVGSVVSNEIIITSIANSSDFYLISNESLDGKNYESTGSFASYFKKNRNVSKLGFTEKYDKIKVNPYLKFDGPIIADYRNQFRKSIKYSVGDIKEFFTYNFKTKKMEIINSKLQVAGNYCEVWTNNTSLINKIEAEKIATEFDQKIYKLVSEFFYIPSDIDSNGKVAILCYDIKDNYKETGMYAAGYFNEADLTGWYYANDMEIFYIDTYPGMYDKDDKFDVTLCYETLVHEFQHMVNFNKIYFVDGNKESETQPLWLNEGLSQAAEQIYKGSVLDYRINTYSQDRYAMIRDGYSMLNWDDNLEDYSLSYLFLQYIKVQSKQGDVIFKEIFEDKNHNYKSIEKVAQKYIKSDITFGELMTIFRAALLKMDSTGLYGFQGAEGFENINTPIYYGGVKNLYGGGAVVIPAADILSKPMNHGENIKYIKITK
jgi:hypothetical protein